MADSPQAREPICAQGHDFMAPVVVRTESRYLTGRGRVMERAVSFCRKCGKVADFGWQAVEDDG